MRDHHARLTRLIDEAAARYHRLIEVQYSGRGVDEVRAAQAEARGALEDFRWALAELAALRDRREGVADDLLVRDYAIAA